VSEVTQTETRRLGYWLTIVSNLAVIGGLVFVGLEIRVNTAATQSAIVQAVTSESRTALAAIAADSTLASLRLRGNADQAGLNLLEKYQYFNYYRSYWLHFQNVFVQRRLGVLDEGIWSTYARVICIDLEEPGIRETWPDHSVVLDPDFVEFVESCPS